VLAALLAAGLAHAGTARVERTASARLDSIATAFAQRGFAGTICVIRGADTLLDRGYGKADRGAGIANTPATRYPIGSLTKSFTAAAVMKLVESGRLRTTDSLRRWVPEASAAWSGVTLRHLLSHTGGIPDLQDDSDYARFGREGSPGPIAARRYAGRPLDFPSGSSFAYSNTGYQVLGAAIEAAAARFTTTPARSAASIQ
jgi:CubicO group peptidase (beta-lactamase class C family)